ncbi:MULTISPECIES: M24 family metallopeptidase [Halomonas]|uniref:Aminopeptidase P family protein n=1 Tax=Halomonas casei TaxID=2742613 RepID=A0ABR9EZA5_9GAMM|nr:MULTISPECIES: Xaa-Pro peptidase family protein [Halomonas]MBE0399554.1 aminopeptidase P family protein [Halomonas casei]PCC23434.1 peptidase M24 [Halomonas sp. JB37]
MILEISVSEIKGRQETFLTNLKNKGCDAALLFSVTDIFYLTGFNFRPSERPMALIVDGKGAFSLFVPKMEVEHAREYAVITDTFDYPEYPGITHPMEYLKQVLQDKNFSALSVGVDAEGYGSAKGYAGPAITALVSFAKKVSIKGVVEEQRYIKSTTEIELIKESARWGNLAHSLLAKYTLAGGREMEAESRATQEATKAMFETLGAGYRPYGSPAHAFYRGQIGPHSAFPHSQNQNALFKKGYNVVSQAACDVWGYKSELERTMFIEEASKVQEEFFQHMYEAQEVAFKNIKPGIPASTVEQEVQRYFKDNGLTQYVKHHTGHNMGLLNHEAPFFDLGDHTLLQAGMVFSVEPGLYVEGLGAFRHSDTIVVTEDGMDMITYFPRDFESLIIG